MKISVVGFKGGIGKTTTAIHLAAYLQQFAPALLIDGDPNRSATGWASRGALPFRVEGEREAARSGVARDFEHIIIDTEARPSPADLQSAARVSDLLVMPSTPDTLSLEALLLTVGALEDAGLKSFRILLTIIPPRPSRDGDEARAMLRDRGLPVFKSGIRRAVAFQKAALVGSPVYDVADPRAAQAWADYEKVGKELV